MGMIHFSAEFSSRTKADFNELSGELIKVNSCFSTYARVSEGQNVYMPF